MGSKLDHFCRLVSVTGDLHLSCRWSQALSKYNKVMGYPPESSFLQATQLLAKGFVTIEDVRILGEYLPHSVQKLLLVYDNAWDDVIPYFMDMLLDDLEVNYNE